MAVKGDRSTSLDTDNQIARLGTKGALQTWVERFTITANQAVDEVLSSPHYLTIPAGARLMDLAYTVQGTTGANLKVRRKGNTVSFATAGGAHVDHTFARNLNTANANNPFFEISDEDVEIELVAVAAITATSSSPYVIDVQMTLINM